MVVCCVPKCYTDSLKCDPSITFHDFPSNPDLAAKWITQINSVLNNGSMWFPRGKSVVCSKHFTQSDFKPDSYALKPRCVPSVFGSSSGTQNVNKRKCEFTSSPLIVKVLKPSEIRHGSQSPSISRSPMQLQASKANGTIVSSPTNNFNVTQSSPTIQNVFSVRSLGQQVTSILKPISPQNMCIPGSQQKQVTSVFKPTSPNMPPYRYQPKQQNSNITNKTPAPKKYQKKVFSPSKKSDKVSSDLIEIGPNTFLKINPDIIKVNKKQTPSGNTVLQFIMNQKLAMSQGDNILPKLIQHVGQSPTAGKGTEKQTDDEKELDNQPEVQHILGHMVDTHICRESCSEFKRAQNELDSEMFKENEDGKNSKVSESKNKINEENKVGTTNCPIDEPCAETESLASNDDSACIAKAPILLTTNVPFSHYFTDKSKYSTLMRQKSRQIAAMKLMISKLTQKVEELEDKCIVQERQLSYSFIKRIKTIRKLATKGDPAATYILEQIRGYAGKNAKTRWSDTTLTQCAIWCRKAPYAYEYFKKAKFFLLPCLGTVKRFIKSHPDLKFQSKPNTNKANIEDDDSSSDFDFDDTDSEESDKNEETNIACETILSVPSEISRPGEDFEKNPEDSQLPTDAVNLNEIPPENAETISSESNVAVDHIPEDEQQNDNIIEGEEGPLEVDRSDLEIQELILPSGEIVQCISSALCDRQDGNQYYIIPTVNDQNPGADHQYSIVQSDSIILQNIENSHLSGDQQELIFITNSAEQVECSQTEITSA